MELCNGDFNLIEIENRQLLEIKGELNLILITLYFFLLEHHYLDVLPILYKFITICARTITDITNNYLAYFNLYGLEIGFIFEQIMKKHMLLVGRKRWIGFISILIFPEFADTIFSKKSQKILIFRSLPFLKIISKGIIMIIFKINKRSIFNKKDNLFTDFLINNHF